VRLPTGLAETVQVALEDFFGASIVLESATAVGGGCIHHATRLETSQGPIFLKYNHPHEFGNFEAERRGLGLLHATSTLRTPEPFVTGQSDSHAFFAMEFLESGSRPSNFWEDFGQQLAQLHRQTAPQFGLDHDNFIGRLLQSNRQHPDWVTFFREERLAPQLQLAQQNGLAGTALQRSFERLYPQLDNLMPPSEPSLLHGDLWSGNFMTGPDGLAAIFDPAVYYGHREAEIAFTELFGGYAPAFYRAYNEAWPLEMGWKDRVDLFNLYPLMVHLNLFGLGYLPQVQRILNRYT